MTTPPSVAFDVGAFGQRLNALVEAAVRRLPTVIGSERLYALALYTSGESDFVYVLISANTEEGLTRVAAKYAERQADAYAGEAGRRALRWSAPDWAYHDFDPSLEALELPDYDDRPPGLDEALYAAFVEALARCDRAGLFGEGEARAGVTLNVVCGDQGEAFFVAGLEALNPPAVVERFKLEFTPEGLRHEFAALPEPARLEALLRLAEELHLGVDSPLARRARETGLSTEEIEGLVAAFGPAAFDGLLDLVERHGDAEAFNAEGSAERRRHGAYTRASSCASRAALAAGRVPADAVDDDRIDRVRRLIGRYVERDRGLALVSPLAENLARSLHRLRPGRFPPSALDASSNHLANAEAFGLPPQGRGGA